MTAMTSFGSTPKTLSEKLDWLDVRYWRFGHDELLEDHLFELYAVGQDGARTAQPCGDTFTGETRGLMVLGRSGDGKTALLMRTLRASPVLREFGQDMTGNTLFITVPPEATVKKLAELILARTGYKKIDSRLRSSDAWEMVVHRLGKVGITTVVIDECHHMFRTGAGRDKQGAIQSLKHILQSAGGVALIVAGVPSLRDEILAEPSGETYRRFQELKLSAVLPDTRNAALFATNLRQCAGVLGIHIPADDAFPERILFAHRGQVGRCVNLAKEILREATTRGRDALSLAAADRVFRKSNTGVGQTPFHDAPWETVRVELEAIGWGM